MRYIDSVFMQMECHQHDDLEFQSIGARNVDVEQVEKWIDEKRQQYIQNYQWEYIDQDAWINPFAEELDVRRKRRM